LGRYVEITLERDLGIWRISADRRTVGHPDKFEAIDPERNKKSDRLVGICRRNPNFDEIFAPDILKLAIENRHDRAKI